MAGGIFISYRREDARHAAGRLVDRLGRTFKPDQIFLDVDNIEPGLDFVKVLSEQVQKCDVLLAVIGPGWLDAKDERGARRLDNPRDFVRIEIEAALARDIRVVPVLVDGARMPGEDDLPPSLQPLARRNAVRLAHERFAADAEDLTKALARATVSSSQNKVSNDSKGRNYGHNIGATTNSSIGMSLKQLFLTIIYTSTPFLLTYFICSQLGKDVLSKNPPILIVTLFATSIVFYIILRVRETSQSGAETIGMWLGWNSLATFTPVIAYNTIISYYPRLYTPDDFNYFLAMGFGILALSGIVTLRWWRRRRA